VAPTAYLVGTSMSLLKQRPDELLLFTLEDRNERPIDIHGWTLGAQR